MGKTSSRSDEKFHADRKFEKKRQFYEKVRTAVAKRAISKEKQKKTRSRQKKLKAYNLSSLLQDLPELKAPTHSRPAEFKLNCKTRNDLVLKESDRLKTVINHPIFQSDPLAAIYQHLQNTQPAVDEKPKRKDGKTRKNKAKRKSPNPPSRWRFRSLSFAFFNATLWYCFLLVSSYRSVSMIQLVDHRSCNSY